MQTNSLNTDFHLFLVSCLTMFIEDAISPGVFYHKFKRHIHQQLSATDYKRQPPPPITRGSKQLAKTIVLARHGMLECGTNYQGTMPMTCPSCSTIDNENHRLNECRIYNDTNLLNTGTNVNFDDIFSDESNVLSPILNHINNVWECQYANGRMKRN